MPGENCTGPTCTCRCGSTAELGWTWHTDQSVGFVRRRETHEALIHRIDAEVITGSLAPMGARLSGDGSTRRSAPCTGHAPEWAMISPNDSGVIRLQAADTGSTWPVTSVGSATPIPTTARAWTRPASSWPTTPEPRRRRPSQGRRLTWIVGFGAARPSPRSGDHLLVDQLEMVIGRGMDWMPVRLPPSASTPIRSLGSRCRRVSP